MSNKNKSSKRNQRKSQKGKWGHIGAPPKPTKFPKRPFTMEILFKMNKNQCELSVRNKVDDALSDGTLLALKSLKQKGGAVGRPKSRFVLKANYDASKMELAPAKTVKVTPTTATVTAEPAPAVVTPAPVAATPVVETPATVVETPAAPLPTVETILVESYVSNPLPPATPVTEIVATEAPAAPVTSEPVIEIAPAIPAIG